jgi:hypothetical protein
MIELRDCKEQTLDKRTLFSYYDMQYDNVSVRIDGCGGNLYDDEHDGGKTRAGSRQDTETQTSPALILNASCPNGQLFCLSVHPWILIQWWFQI